MIEELLDRRQHIITLRPESTIGVRTPCREVAQCALEAVNLTDLGFGIDVDGTIKDHPPYSMWEHFRIERTDLGTVRRAEVVDLGIADQLPHQIKIAHGLHR